MLAKLIKQKIEDHASLKVRYPKDCEILSEIITKACGQRISASTLKRLFGFTKGTETARLMSLDLIAQFLGHDTYDQLIANLYKQKTDQPMVKLVHCKKLKAGTELKVSFGSISKIHVRNIEGGLFETLDQIKTDLKNGDRIRLEKIELDAPLVVYDRESNGVVYGKLLLGKITGVTKIIEL